MEALRRFAKRASASVALGVALLAFDASTTARAALPTLAQHLSAVDTVSAGQYVGKAPYRVVSATELARMKAYIHSQYAGVKSVHVFAYDDDLVVDCVDQYTQLGATRHGLNASNWKTAPTHLPQPVDRLSPSEPRPLRDPGVFLMRTDRDAHGNLRGCEPGSVPVNRITLEMVARYPTVADYERRWLRPSIAGHEYAKASFPYYSNAGGQAYIYAWNPFLELDHEETILQLWVVAGSTGDDTLETIEAGWQKAPHNWTWGKDYPHLFLFASKGNYATMQWDNGSWFVQTDHSVDLGGKLTLSSVTGGSQYSTKYYIYKDGASSTGDWWFNYDGVWVGYYPYTEFTSSGLRNAAAVFDVGGEVYNSEPSGRHTKTDMGSGYQPSSGWGYAAYMRMIRWIDTSNTWVIPNPMSLSYDNANCYAVEPHYNGGPGWESYIYLGGEGYNSQTCP